MLRFLMSRLAQSAFILIGVTAITFSLAFLVPADPVRMIAGRNATPTVVENIRTQLGLDRPLPEQYARFKEPPADAWGKPLRLICPAQQLGKSYVLESGGPDGEPGGLDRIQ